MIISEIGINHKGNEFRAFEMLKKLVKTNIDAVTFQVIGDSFYNNNTTWGGPLSKEFYKKAIDFIHKNSKQIGFAVEDSSLVSFLDELGADFWKTLSTDISNYSLHECMQKTNKIMFLSTGMSNESEIFDLSRKLKNIKFIHTQLSHNLEDVNLKAISKLNELTGLDIAFGLHCSDIMALYLSTTFEPSDIFFYVKDISGEKYPDDEHAIFIDELPSILKKMDNFKKMIGDGIKKRTENKLK